MSEEKRMLYEKSSDARVLEMFLMKMTIGQLASYEDMSAYLGKDVLSSKVRSALQTARNTLQRERRMVFGCERGIGLRRLNDEQIVGSIESDCRRIQRVSRRSMKKLAAANFDALSPEGKRKHVVHSAQLGALALFSTRKAAARIETRVKDGDVSLPIDETLRLFGEAKQ